MAIRRSVPFHATISFWTLTLALVAAPAQALIAFGPPQALNSTASTDSDDVMDDDVDGFVSLAGDDAGNWVALWSSDNSLGNTTGTDSDILVATSSNGGQNWSPAEAAMAEAFVDGSAPDTSPCVAYGNGVFVLVFSSGNSLGGTIGTDSDLLISRSLDNGATWSAPALLNSGGASDIGNALDVQPSIATDGNGAWLVVWKHNSLTPPTGDQTFYSFSTDDGASWSAQQSLGGLRTIDVGNGQGTAVVWNGSTYIAAWGSSESILGSGMDGDIHYSILTPPLFLATPAALLNNTGSSDGASGSDKYPSLSAIGSSIVAAWETNANIGMPTPTGTDYDIVYSRSSNAGATWSAVAPLGSHFATDVAIDTDVALANDGSTFIAVWDSDFRLDNLSIDDPDILTARLDDAGSSWTPTATLATNASKDKGEDKEPAIAAVAATGTWNVAWESVDTLGKTIGGDEDILTVHATEDCPAVPVAAASCFEPTAPETSSIIIKEAGAKDSFLWKFAKGEAVDKALDIGNPSSTDDYALCVYDESLGVPELLIEMDIQAGGNCFVKPCWTDIGVGYKYKHKFGTVATASLTAGGAGTSKASVKAKVSFQAPTLPLDQDTTVSVRLHNLANGKCFATEFSTSSTNDAGMFKAKSD